MSRTLENLDHIRAWLRDSEKAGRITWTPGHREKFADLYSLYRSTTQGVPVPRQAFAMSLELSTVPAVKGAGNLAYRLNVGIVPAS